MANNRLFLCHRPTRRAIMLGKNMGVAFYSAPESEELETFFDKCFDEATIKGLDTQDFVLLREDQPGWNYSQNPIDREDRFIVFEETQEVQDHEQV